jgi:hypothetical protein
MLHCAATTWASEFGTLLALEGATIAAVRFSFPPKCSAFRDAELWLLCLVVAL